MSSANSADLFVQGVAPFAMPPEAKAAYLREHLGDLLEHHRRRCPAYARLVSKAGALQPGPVDTYPYIPVTVFKEYDLRSTDDPVLSVRSSSTTSDQAARIFVDRPTRKRQTLSANRILADFLGAEQRPYIVFDAEQNVRGTATMSARGAAILSLGHLASEFYFVMRMRDDGSVGLDLDVLDKAVAAAHGRAVLGYGFTYVMYQVHQDLARAGRRQALHPDSVLLHGGGWKRLQDKAVDRTSFNRTVANVWGLAPSQVVDMYGTVEQVGVPYPDCPAGRKHVPYWADVVMRRADSLAAAGVGERGLIQLLNCLPLSAPNHSVLTEDLGELVTLDGCSCGRRGKAFIFHGRAPRAELRGCSDVARR